MKVLILGLGSISLKHIAALKKINPSIQIDVLRRKNSPKSDNKDINEITSLSAIDYDFIMICTPTFTHHTDLEKVLQYNAPIFIEKPVFHEISKSNDFLIKAVKQQKIRTYVACNLRFTDSLIQFKKNIETALLNGEKIEEVSVYCGSYLPDWRKITDFRQNYSANKDKGGGVHLDLIHEMDYVLWFFGIPLTLHARLKSQSSLDINAIDAAYYQLDYSKFTARIALNYFRRIPKRTFEIVGSNHVYLLDLLKGKIWIDGTLTYESRENDILHSYEDQLEHFISVLESDKEFENNLENGYLTLKYALNEVKE